MAPATASADLYRGDTFTFTVRVFDPASNPRAYTDLTGWAVRAQLRSSSGAPLATFATTIADQTTNRGLITLSLTVDVTAGLSPDQAVSDVELTSPTGVVSTVLRLSVWITADVTR